MLLGISKTLWIGAIYRVPIAKCVALGSSTPAITMIRAYLFLGTHPTGTQLVAFIPIALGVLLISGVGQTALSALGSPLGISDIDT